jgi:cobalt-zinc-cadmium efflux system membrane fusion protein
MTSALWRLIVMVALLALSCRSGGEEEGDRGARRRVDGQGRVVLTQAERAALGLDTATAAQGSLTTSRLRFGRVVAGPQGDVLVTAPVTGRLTAPTVSLGATVRAGDALVTMEPLVDAASRGTLGAQRRELQGQVEAARAQVEAKRADLTRVTTLVSSGLATDADRAQAEAALTAEQVRVESLQRAMGELARITGGRMELRAPAAGVVAMIATEAGSVIQQGTVVARIVRAGPRWIDVAVPPGDPIGNSYRVHGVDAVVPANLVVRGAVVQADGTRRDRLEAAPDAAPSLPPGAVVPVEVLHETQGVVVPVSALVRRGHETIVFIEIEPGRFLPRPVHVAARDDARAVLSSGVAPGERIVTRGASSLLGELGAERGGRVPGGEE